MSRGCALGPPPAAGADASAPAAWPPAAGAAVPSPAPGVTVKHHRIAIYAAANFLTEIGSRAEAAATAAAVECMTSTTEPIDLSQHTAHESARVPKVLCEKVRVQGGQGSLTCSTAPGLLLRDVQALRNACHKVLDGPVGVVEGRAQRAHHIFPWEAHLADLHSASITPPEGSSYFWALQAFQQVVPERCSSA